MWFALLSFAMWPSVGEALANRVPWNGFRFLQQSSQFINPLPFLKPPQTVHEPGSDLWSSSLGSFNSFTMAPLDDVVMGGASDSSFEKGVWKGIVTDANNGGFIGLRSTPAFCYNLSSCNGLEWDLDVKGERSRRFKFVVRDSDSFNGITWTSCIDLQPGETTVRIPFDTLVPARFAKVIPDETFRKDNVVGVQITYSKFEFNGELNPKFELGAIQLELLDLRTY